MSRRLIDLYINRLVFICLYCTTYDYVVCWRKNWEKCIINHKIWIWKYQFIYHVHYSRVNLHKFEQIIKKKTFFLIIGIIEMSLREGRVTVEYNFYQEVLLKIRKMTISFWKHAFYTLANWLLWPGFPWGLNTDNWFCISK